ncbi:MAG TPA: hypothetical protein VER57_06550 [Cyanobium sp.]|nr:hypothetical protein [Cyanobium sp.]
MAQFSCRLWLSFRCRLTIESHAAYLGHWIELLKESPRVLFQVLSEARQAADLICPEAPGQLEPDGEPHPA